MRASRLTLGAMAALLALTLTLATACDSDDGGTTSELGDPNLESSPTEALRVARALWAANGSDDYDMRFNWLCFCLVEAVEERNIEIRDGAVVSGGLPPDFGLLAERETIEGLFELIADAIDRDAASLEITYHATLGYPLNASIDYDFQIADEELAFTVHELTLR